MALSCAVHHLNTPCAGAFGPILLSVVPLNTYAMVFSLMISSLELDVAAACGAAFVATVVCVTVPLYFLVSWRTAVARARDAASLKMGDASIAASDSAGYDTRTIVVAGDTPAASGPAASARAAAAEAMTALSEREPLVGGGSDPYAEVCRRRTRSTPASSQQCSRVSTQVRPGGGRPSQS